MVGEFQPPPITIRHICGANLHIPVIHALSPKRCPKCNQIINIPLEYLIADRYHFHAFGDESSFKEIVVYGVVVLHDFHMNPFQRFLVNLKLAYGVPSWAKLHCREVFNGDAKKKTGWKRLSETQVFQFSADVLTGLVASGASFFVGAVDKNEYPSELTTSVSSSKTTMGNKQLTALVFQGALLPLSEVFQSQKIRLYADSDKTLVSFFGRKGRADKNYKFANPLTGTMFHPEINEGRGKHQLMEVADLFAYVAAHALSGESARNKDRFRALYQICKPTLSTLVYDPEEKIQKSKLEINHDSMFSG